MRPHARRRLIATAAAVVVLMGFAGPAEAAPALDPGTHPALARTAQQLFWKWSDGSSKTSRLFKETKYKDADALPTLVVSAVPTKPARTVYLQFKKKGAWVVESKGTTNKKGVVRLALYPYCSNDSWCDGTYDYRLKAGSLYQNFRITYAEK